MSAIFINYRRRDAKWIADRIAEWLRCAFGTQRVFKDVNSIDGGVNYRQRLQQALDESQVMLTIIGPH